MVGRREQCTYGLNPRSIRCIYSVPIAEGRSFSIPSLCVRDTVWTMVTPSITDPFAIASTSKEVLLCFFGVYGSVLVFTLSLAVINAGVQYSWEYCVSLWFDWMIVTRQYRLGWPLVRPTISAIPGTGGISFGHVKVPYFLSRYSGLASLIAK